MKKYLSKFLLGSLLLVSHLTLFAATTNTTTAKTPVVFDSPHKPIIVTAPQTSFTITLQSNATTGYRWYAAAYDKKLITDVERRYVAPTTQLMGVPGYEVWTFKLAAAPTRVQTTEVMMYYMRPWEKEIGQNQVFKIQLLPSELPTPPKKL